MANEKLTARSLAEYREGIEHVEFPLSDEQFIALLRIYYWHLHEAGFQDIYDKSIEVYKVLEKYQDVVDEYELSVVINFIMAYVNEGNYVDSVFNVHYSLEQILKTMEKEPESKEDTAVIADYKEMMLNMDQACHQCYWVLKSDGYSHLPVLYNILVTLAPVYQEFILHAIDGSGGKEVIEFYERFISETKDMKLKEKAEEYLKNVKKA